jgi:hypothetical protein
MRHRPHIVAVYRPALGSASFEEWLFSTLGPPHRRALTAGIHAILPAWGMETPSTGFGKRHGPELVEFRLRFDARALRLRAPRATGPPREATDTGPSPALGCSGHGPVVLGAFFTCRDGRLVVLSGGGALPAEARTDGSTRGLHEARWRLRELNALQRAGVHPFGGLAKDALEPILRESPAGDTTPDPNAGAVIPDGAQLLDFAVIHKRVRREAEREGRCAVAELRAVHDRVRLAASLVARRKAVKLTQRQLATLSDIEQGEISRLERAGTNPTLQTIGALAEALGVEVCLRPRE